ncbi:MAG: HIT family protein [Acidimicrobiia bacterium]
MLGWVQAGWRHKSTAMMSLVDSVPLDAEKLRRSLRGVCFICEIVKGNPNFDHYVFYDDGTYIAFLDKYPMLVGHSLVAPQAHLEQVTGDLSEEEYLALQRVVYRVGEALRRLLPTERLYIVSLGSQQGNRHVHWHVAPLPPGIPFEEQQYRALDRPVYLAIPEEDMKELASKLASLLSQARNDAPAG